MPTSTYVKKLLGNRVYVSVEPYPKAPSSSVSLQNYLSVRISSSFDVSIVLDPKKADSKVYTKISDVTLDPLSYSSQGYVAQYDVSTSLTTTYIDIDGKRGTISTKGNYDFRVGTTGVYTSSAREDAIFRAASSAANDLVNQLAVVKLTE